MAPMKIGLLRHGRPEVDGSARISASEMRGWIARYDKAELCESSIPTEDTQCITASFNSVFCSNLPRSIGSAKAVKSNGEITESPLFRELPLPDLNGELIKLKPGTWTIVLRALWLAGYSRNAESFTQSKSRIRKATRMLVDEAHKNNSVLLVGHGFTNVMIAKALIGDGWMGPSRPRHGHWGASVYERV